MLTETVTRDAPWGRLRARDTRPDMKVIPTGANNSAAGPQGPRRQGQQEQDARVNPRQGLTWALRSRELGGNTTLWYDPHGTHDTGIRTDSNPLTTWVTTMLEQEQSAVGSSRIGSSG